MSVPDPRTPVLVGTARRTWHPSDEPAPEPLDMWAEIARAASDDAGTDRDLIAEVDDLSVVHCQSWAYDDPAARLVDELALGPGHREVSILAGTSPQRLIAHAAERMLAGETSVALVVGAEALHTRKVLERAGEGPHWRHPHDTPPVLPIDIDEWYLPTEVAHGMLPAWLTFALLEQARWAARGATAADRDALFRTLADLNAVAVDNPDAWFHDRRTAADIAGGSLANRMVTTPYTKWATAFMDVDMAAGQLLMTLEAADRLGVPEDRRVFLRGWGFAREAVHLGARADLTASAAMVAATGTALKMADVSAGDVDVFDLYSCFGSAVAFGRDALGLLPDDPRPVSVTGGLASHGGPSSNYMGHSISHLVDRLRANPGEVGMTTGIGMHMTKHVAGVWSATPGPLGTPPPHTDQSWLGDQPDDVVVVDEGRGPATILAATAICGRDGTPERAVTICGLPGGTRCYATSDDAATVGAVAEDAWVGVTAELREGLNGTNLLTF
ncbi:MAG: acetyl-CoA synthetase [Microthrixaceae bacterium]